MRKITKRTATIVATAALGVGALGATAWAAGWFSGSANATVKTASAVAITGTISFATPIYPTGDAGVTFTLTNPNDYKVKITGITVAPDATIVKDAGQREAACTFATSGITFTSPNLVLAKGTATRTVAGVAHMNENASPNCEGIASSTPVPVTLTGVVTNDAPTPAV